MIRRLWSRLARWWLRPAPPPEKIGQVRPEKHRPITVQLGFTLHADGTVYHIPRNGAGVRKVTHPALRELVYEDYRTLVGMARRRARWEAVRRALLRERA